MGVEVRLLGRLGALAGDLERQPRLERDRDGAVRALVRAHPPEEEQVVALLGVVRVEGEVERVRDVRDPGQLRPRLALAERERDQLRVRRHAHDLLVEVARVAVDRPVHGVHERRRQQRPDREAEQAGVVVDDVEVVVPREAVERVLELPEGLADPLARRLLEDGRELRARARVAGGEERDVVPGVGEPVREQRDDPLDPAVAGRRHREPDRAEDGDLRALRPRSPTHAPAATRTFHGPPERADAVELEPVQPTRAGRRGERTSAARRRARARAGAGAAAPACPPPTPAAAPRSDRRSGTASPRAEAGEHLRQRPVEEARRGEERLGDPVRCRPALAGAREPPRAERRVVRPDGAVVVAERVVGGVAGRHRPDPPPRPELVAISRLGDGLDALGRHDPAPEQVARCSSRASRPALVAVERERVVAAALVDPERLVEAPLQLGRLGLEPLGERARPARPRASSAGSAPSRRRRSPAPRPARSACARTCRRGSAASRPSPSRTGSRARAACGARTRRTRRRRGRRTRRSSAAPRAPARGSARRRSDRRSSARPPGAGRGRAASRRRCRSSAEPRLGRPAAPQLVDDLARLGVDRRVVLVACSAGERLERGDRELGAEQHRLQARDQRVAPEDGHEPRHPGGREHPDAVVRRASAARRGRRPTARTRAGGRRARLQPRHAGARPSSDSPGRARAPRRSAARRRAAAPPRRERRRRRRSAGPSAPAARGRGRSGPEAVDARPCARADLRLGAAVRSPRARAGCRLVVADRGGRRQRPGVERVAEGEVVLLDRDDVREVGADLELELERERRSCPRCGARGVLHPLARRSARARSRASPARARRRPGCAGRTRPRSTRPSRRRAAAAGRR